METTGNIAGMSLAALLFIGAWGASSHARGADSKAPGRRYPMKEEYVVRQLLPSEASCDTKSSLAGDHPVLSANRHHRLLWTV